MNREMREAPSSFIQLFALLILCCINESNCSSYSHISSSKFFGLNHDMLPFLPQTAPSPLVPFTNKHAPKLSGLCALDFSAHENLLNKTATDCWGPFAPYLSNAICCPQYKASLTILIGNSSKYSGELALYSTQAKHCLMDIDKILESQGAIENIHETCSISHVNLTRGSCPIANVNEIDPILDNYKLKVKCGKIDVASECCTRVCQKEISKAALEIASKGYHNSSKLIPIVNAVNIEDCESVVLRWLATKLDSISMYGMLRGISSCDINKVCPLVLPNTADISRNCGNETRNQSACCIAMENYVSQLQNQTLVTNLQALKCAEMLGISLKKANVTRNIYDLCQVKLNDFTLQVAGAPVSSEGLGCLLPSLPSDATYDNTYGISFVCDLNDSVAAPWPSSSFSPASSYNDSAMLPALPKATSAGNGVAMARKMFHPATIILSLFVYYHSS